MADEIKSLDDLKDAVEGAGVELSEAVAVETESATPREPVRDGGSRI